MGWVDLQTVAVCPGSNLRDFLNLLKRGEHKAEKSGVQTKVLEVRA